MFLDELRRTTQPIFFITNDVARGVGLEELLPNYHIVCLDDHPLVDILQKSGVSVFCLEKYMGSKNIFRRSSGVILEHPQVISFIKEKSGDLTPYILFFKPQKKIEIIAGELGFKLIGNSADLNKIFEDKVNFLKLAEDKIPLPPAQIQRLFDLDFEQLAKKYGSPLVIQFGFGWAGNSTFFVDNPFSLEKIKSDYGNIWVKAGKFIKGITALNNAVLYHGKIIQSAPALQIKAHPLLTATQAGTGGRQWPAGLSKEHEREIFNLTKKVGELMGEKGYRGFFGLDFLVEQGTGKLYLSEVNARLTASASFYTKMETKRGIFPLLGYHLLSFMDVDRGWLVEEEGEDKKRAICGSEIVARNTKSFPVMVNGGFTPGIYDQNLQFLRESYFLEKGSGDNLWITTAGKGRIVNPETETIRVNTENEVCDKKGNLRQEYVQIVQKIYQRLHVENVRKR